jgi:hypothetical protein
MFVYKFNACIQIQCLLQIQFPYTNPMLVYKSNSSNQLHACLPIFDSCTSSMLVYNFNSCIKTNVWRVCNSNYCIPINNDINIFFSDTDRLEFVEFKTLIKELYKKNPNDKNAIRNAFKVLDRDQSGYIEAKELKVKYNCNLYG